MIKGKLFVKNKINPRDENYALSFDLNPPNIDYQLAKLLKLRNNSNESRNKIFSDYINQDTHNHSRVSSYDQYIKNRYEEI